MDWTEDYFDEFYLKYFLENQNEEFTVKQTEFIAQFFDKNGLILDAGCGIGRHSLKLGEMGFRLIGADSSPLYIKIAKQKSLEKNLSNVDFLVKDLRKLIYKEKFSGIISLWSSFGYFSDEVNFQILKNFYAALKSGGRLIIDIENRDYILKYFIRETFREKDKVFILERRRFHPLTSVVVTHRYVIGENIRKDYVRNIRIYSATEMINLFKRTGAEDITVYGSYEKEKFSERSKRIIIIGKKP